MEWIFKVRFGFGSVLRKTAGSVSVSYSVLKRTVGSVFFVDQL